MGRHTLFRSWPSALPAAVCDAIVEDAEVLSRFSAAVNSTHRLAKAEVKREVRRTDVSFFPDAHWVHGILWHYASLANNEQWQLDIRVCPGAQYGVYSAGGHYHWHQDEFDQPYDRFSALPYVGFNRKLSVVVNLSDPDEYDGGRFQVRNAFGQEVDVPGAEARGSVVVFPSSVVHRAGLVGSGTRRSLVGWVLGPSLR